MDHQKTGGLIAQTRKEKGLTQKELAQRLHVSDRAVSKWERGAGFPDISLLEPLSQALELTVSELLRGEREAEGMTVREAVEVLSQERRRKIARLRRLARRALLPLVCAAVLLFILSIPSSAPHDSFRKSVSVESFLGGYFTVPLINRGSYPGPGTEYFSTTISPKKVVDRILEQPQAVSAASLRLPGQGDWECWLLTLRGEDGMAGYAFLRGEREGLHWRYRLNEASDFYEGEIPFPSYLLSDKGWPTYFSDGEAVPTIFREEELQTAFQALREFYLGEGCTDWYDVQADGDSLSLRVAANQMLKGKGWGKSVREEPFQVSLLAQGGQVYVRLDP